MRAVEALSVGRGRMRVVPLNPSQEKGYAIDSFLAVLGQSRPEAEVAVPSRNVSPSASATEAAREVKRHLIASGASHKMTLGKAILLAAAVTVFSTLVFSYALGLPFQRFGPWWPF